jgi:hypothetical protein
MGDGMPSEAPLAARIREIAEGLKAARAARNGTGSPATAPAGPPVAAPVLPEPARPVTPVRDLVAEYQCTLARLWLLNVPSEARDPRAHAADLEDARQLRAEQARLCDELGPEFALAVSRTAAREWARDMGRCPWCGLAVFRDPATGEGTAP